MKRDQHTFHWQNPFELESGKALPSFQLHYTTAGQINKERNNVIWVCHALTGSADFTDWWPALFSDDGPLSPQRYFIICANLLSGCYGSTGPLSVNPSSGAPYYHDFPLVTNRDVVRAFDLLRDHLGIEHVHALLGGSLGGQHVLEWAIFRPAVFEHIIPIACNAAHSPWGIAFNEAQRMAIEADETWRERHHRAGASGMRAARAIGMLSYRHYNTYGTTQAEKTNNVINGFRAASYQQYQGTKLANRFNAFTYYRLTQMMDSHNVGRGRESIETALKAIRAKALVIGIDSDVLFPLQEQQFLAANIEGATLAVLSSRYGHDGFLVELDDLKKLVADFFTRSNESVLI